MSCYLRIKNGHDVANEVNRICLRMFLAASRARIVVASLI